MSELLNWKNSEGFHKADRLPLFIHGTRQVGKTHTMLEFGETFYKNQVYINFERMQNTHYLITGGMPAVVKAYAADQSISGSTPLQEDILNSYIADMTKYTTSGENMRIKGSYDSMPAQLSKGNKKFQYKLVRKGATANLFGESIEWLLAAGIVLKCSKVNAGTSPLEAQKALSSFKLYMSDVGLYRAKARLLPEEIVLGNYDARFKRAMAENYVVQSLVASKHTIYYWESNSQAAVDFVFQDEHGKVIPVEVKYDTNVRAKRLGVFMNRYQSPYAIRISAKNFGFENKIKAVPLYACPI